MTKEPLQSLELAACGLKPADWSDHYYPDDLPTAWRIAYYHNEFKQLFLPAGQWQITELAEWQDEVSATFRFYVGITAAQVAATDWLQTAAQLSEMNCAAVVRDKQLADTLRGVVRRVDLLTDDEVLLQPLWQQEQEQQQLALLRSTTDLSALQLRELFEDFKLRAQCPELVVFLDTPYQTVEKMRRMCELYGW